MIPTWFMALVLLGTVVVTAGWRQFPHWRRVFPQWGVPWWLVLNFLVALLVMGWAWFDQHSTYALITCDAHGIYCTGHGLRRGWTW